MMALWETIRLDLRATPAMAKIALADTVAYRAEMAIWILTASMPLVMLALWNAVARGGPVAGFDQPELARYFAANLVVRQLTGSWIMWELSWHIRSGTLSPKLLRPVDPIYQSAVWMVAALPLRVLMLVPMLAALLFWRPELAILPDPAAFALFVVSVSMAWLLSFLIQATFAMLAFWLDQSMGLFGVWFSLWMILSGYIAPTSMFPEWAREILRYLPFRAMLGTPVELLGGFVTAREALPDVALQAGWCAVLLVLTTALWKRGIRRYGAYGA